MTVTEGTSLLERMDLSQLGEFSLIKRIEELLKPTLSSGQIGIGDDCAVIPLSDERSLLVTTDMMVEGVHFLKNKISPRDLGFKSLAVNLSDIAAMGGKPTSAFLSISLPQQIELKWVEEFILGFRELSHKYNVQLLGGDTTGAVEQITISITLIGEANPQYLKLRSNAKPGEIICVTDYLGDSAAGLKLLKDNLHDDYLLKKHLRPYPPVEQGLWLGTQDGVHAMMDLSDGIGSDLQRILERSSCGAELHLEKIPFSKAVQERTDKYELAVMGGEDYCLLLTVNQNSFPQISEKYKKQFSQPLYAIGVVTGEVHEIRFMLNGKPQSFQKVFDHFSLT